MDTTVDARWRMRRRSTILLITCSSWLKKRVFPLIWPPTGWARTGSLQSRRSTRLDKVLCAEIHKFLITTTFFDRRKEDMLNRRFLRIKVMQALYAFFQHEKADVAFFEKELFKSLD